MKLITNKLAQVILSLVAIAALIGTLIIVEPNINGMFTSFSSSLTNIGNSALDVDLSPLSLSPEELAQADPAPTLEVSTGTVYETEDFIYMYNYRYERWGSGENDGEWCMVPEGNSDLAHIYGGWSVAVKDTSKTSYSPIYHTIGGKPVVGLRYAFSYCPNLEKAPLLSKYTTDLTYSFHGCKSLKEAPTIPNSVIRMYRPFSSCTQLTGTVNIPGGVTDLTYCFFNTVQPITMEYYSSCAAAVNYSAPSNVTKVCVD